MTLLRMLLGGLAILMAGIVGAEQTPERVNINTADAATLARVLDGVGLKKAEAIVAHREQHGRFDSPADLARVKGIGDATVQRNAEKIRVSDSADDPPTSSPPDDD